MTINPTFSKGCGGKISVAYNTLVSPHRARRSSTLNILRRAQDDLTANVLADSLNYPLNTVQMFGENEYSKRMSLKRLPVGKVIYIVRSFRRRRVRTLILLSTLSVLYFLILLPLSLRHSHSTELASYDAAIAQIPPPRVFIAAMLANCAPLLSQYWVPSLLSTIDKLGPPNVYVSILENGSVDGSRNVLLRLEDRLKSKGVEYTIRYEEDFRDGAKFQEKGLLHRILGDEGTGDNWIMTDKGWLPRRISYLAELRNMVLDPLKQATQPFDKILFINDVIFSVQTHCRGLLIGRRRMSFACCIRMGGTMLRLVDSIISVHIYFTILLLCGILMGIPPLRSSFHSFPVGKLGSNFLHEAPTSK